MVVNLGRTDEGFLFLLQALRDGDWQEKACAADTLSVLADKLGPWTEQAVVDLTRALREREGGGSSRSAPARALGAIGPQAKDAVPVLAKALEDPDYNVRWAAAEALGRIGEPAKAAVPALARTLTDKITSVRRETVVALGRIGPAAKEAIRALKIALKDEAEEVRQAAAKALKKIQAEDRGGHSGP